MNGKPSVPKDVCISLVIMLLAFLVSLLLHTLFAASSSITAIFVLAVFLISLWTQGYVYGIAATFVSMFAVNFAFTFPYFAFNFTIPENLLSAVIMIAVALFTCTLTSRLKRQELLRKTPTGRK